MDEKEVLEGRPGSLIAASDWPGHFPTWSKAVDTCGTITEPKVIPAKVGRSAGDGGVGVVGGTG